MNISISSRSALSAIIALQTVLSAGTRRALAQSQADKPAPSVSSPVVSSPTLRLRSFTIIVRDYDEAKNWYTEKLGFVTLIDQKFGPSQRFVLIAPPGSGNEDVGFVLEKAHRDDPTMPTDYTDRIGKEVNIVLRTNGSLPFVLGVSRPGHPIPASAETAAMGRRSDSGGPLREFNCACRPNRQGRS